MVQLEFWTLKYTQVLWNIQILTRENVVELLTVWVLFCDFYGCSSMAILWKGTWWMEMLYCSTDNPHFTNLASWLTRLVQWSIQYFSVPFHYKFKFVGYKNLQCDHLRRNVLIENWILLRWTINNCVKCNENVECWSCHYITSLKVLLSNIQVFCHA